ncbi:hypothetical protein ASPCAL03995 [Aspergillus calidoustus]|uniref:Uncharacterized protein n=1 Tax=Aspergillus calidoustus TaxID=454130 RepID=A0A0U5FTI0_ASPCI|nr:hypothetical protein ASPCAL03995 [Aspergillus calidoustus]
MMRVRFRLQLCLAALITNTFSYAAPEISNHIFNAIHSSMRQWGSSLNHNGMSFFLATVPEGTELYHGDWRSDPIQGPEWLAFEPEHALVFTHPFPHNPPPRDGPPQPPPPLQLQQVMEKPNQAEDGFLHTFAAAKDLRLLYVDGMSAGKTQNGTMDSQDHVLFLHGLGDGGGGMFDEMARAKLFCQMVQEKWDGRLDGMVRMEAGFEIILCDFARDLEVLRVTRVRASEKGMPGDRIGQHAGKMWLPAVASRYWNIGGDRVILNYEHFVTAYLYELDLFPEGGNLPRLEHLPSDQLERIRRDLDALILDHEPNEPSVDWQAVADMVVERYGNRLRYLASGQAPTLQLLQQEIEDALTPFIDYDQRNSSIEVERCSRQFIRRSTTVTSVAGNAVLSVSRSVCATLLEALQQTNYHTAVNQIQGLMRYLSWTTWKDCNGCGDHEICMIPMWPMGTVNDYKHPQCRDFSQLNGDGPRYWGENPRRRISALPLPL